MAASPVRKLLNTYNFENGEIIDLETTTSTTTTKSQTEQPSTYFEGGAQKRKFINSTISTFRTVCPATFIYVSED